MRSPLMLTASALVLLAAAPAALAQSNGGAIRAGQNVEGSTNSTGRDYTINLRAGEGVEVTMRSDAIDSYLEIYSETGRESLASDDDGLGEGLHSRLRYVASESGQYKIRAKSLGDGASGDFTLGVASWSPPRIRSGNIRVGGEVSGTLNNRSPETETGSRFQQYLINLSKGERIQIDLEADDFDPVLYVGSFAHNWFNELNMNDDGPKGLYSQLVFTAPEDGQYALRAQSISDEGTGSFKLKVAQAKPLPAALPVTLGEPVLGEITNDTAIGQSSVKADRYRLHLREGEHYEISLKSQDFDSYLSIFNSVGLEIASDDDGGNNLDSSLIFSPEEAGEYFIEARGLGDSTGNYELLVEAVPAPPEPVALPKDQEVEGELTDDDARSGSSARYDAYRFSATEGQRLQITLTSGDFDAYLEVGSAEGTFTAFMTDDDGLGSGTDSRLVFEIPSTGDYIVRASSFNSDDRGAYEIRMIDRGPAPQSGSLLIGTTVRGSLNEFDNTTSSGMSGASYYDDYTFTAKKDEKLRFILVSADFDAVVMVGSGEGESFSMTKQDDDGLSDTHARLNWTVPRDGDYVVRATSFGSNSTGNYSLIVERQPRD